MYVSLDKTTGELVLNLPKEVEEYKNDVSRDLMEEYAFEAINRDILEDMDTFIMNWFKKKGIELNDWFGFSDSLFIILG